MIEITKGNKDQVVSKVCTLVLKLAFDRFSIGFLSKCLYSHKDCVEHFHIILCLNNVMKIS